MRKPRNGESRFGGKHPSGHGHPGTNGTNGARPAGMHTRAIALPDPPEEDEEPVDLVALQADDELINALAAGMTVAAGDGRVPDTDDKVSAILAAWKAEVDAEAIPELVDLDTAVSTVQAARRPSGRARHLAPVAAAAAALVTLLGGVSLGSYSAEPDDVLWPVAKVLYSERTTSVEAADRVEERIALAKQAIAAGQPEVAEQQLQAAAVDLAVVRPEEGLAELLEVQDFLKAKAGETLPGVPTDPGAPLAADQTREVPPGAAITSPAARTSELPSPSSGPTEDPVSPPGSPTSSVSEQQSGPPPELADPRIARDDPAPAEQPDVSTAPTPADPPPVNDPQDGTSTEVPPPPPPPAPEQEVDPAAPGVDGGASAPGPAPEGNDSIGATAADTDTTAPSPTS